MNSYAIVTEYLSDGTKIVHIKKKKGHMDKAAIIIQRFWRKYTQPTTDNLFNQHR